METTTGSPIEGALVDLELGGTSKSTVTDAQGRFSFTGLASGSGELRIESTAFAGKNLSVSLQAGQRTDVGALSLEADLSVSEDLVVTAYATTAATKTDTPLARIPQSISVVPSQIVEEQATVRISDAATNASGVIRSFGLGGTNDSITVRGFPPDNIMRNGTPPRFFLGFEEPTNVERLEVIKGPNSALYGQGQLGGFVNLVTKQPSPQLRGSFGIGLGTEGFQKLNMDATGPLVEKAEYRAVAALEDTETFRDEVEVERLFIAPSLRLRPVSEFDLTLSTEISRQDATYDFGIPFVDGEVLDVDQGAFFGEPWSQIRSDVTRAAAVANWAFSSNWNLRTDFRFQENEEEDIFVLPSITDTTSQTGLLERRASFLFEPSETYDLYVNLFGTVETGSVRHNLMFGADVFRISSGFQFGFIDAPPAIPLTGLTTPASRPAIPDADDDTPRRSSRQNGYYFQDQIDVGDRWSFLLGGRWSEERGENLFRVANDEEFNPRLGAVFQPKPNLSFYASYSTSFQSNTAFGTTVDGELFDPLEGKQAEVGVKVDLLDRRLSLTSALYDLRRENVPAPDLANPGFSILVGEERSRGLEVDGVLRLQRRLRLSFAYSFADTEILRSNNANEGNRLANFPEHSGRAWLTYALPSDRLAGLGFNFGVRFMDSRPTDITNAVFLDSFTTFDAAVFLDRDRYRLALNIDNLTDEEYFRLGGPFGPSGIPGGPLEARATFTVRAW
ncbi:MAG: TonB-dependent siderophore receptor [Acidobacteriota bacterium]